MQKYNLCNAISIPPYDYNDLQSLNLRSVKYPDKFNKGFLMKPAHILFASYDWMRKKGLLQVFD